MEIIKSKDDKNRRLEELIIERDALEVDAHSIECDYQKEFGDELIAIFKEEIECIKLKKIITLIQRMKNRGEEIDPELVNATLMSQMKAYEFELNNRIAKLNGCKDAKSVGIRESEEIKTIYKKIVKLIHPDVNIHTEKNDALKKLWEKAQLSYRLLDLEGIKETYILVKRTLDDLGIANDINIDIVNIDEKIIMLEEAISEIVSSEPYIWKELLLSEDNKNKKHKELEEELNKYRDYKELLKKSVDILKG